MKNASKLLPIILLIVALTAFCSVKSEGGQESPSWNLVDKINENDTDLETIPLRISTKKYTYQEERILLDENGATVSRSKVSFTDVEKDIGLKLLDLVTGETEVIKITKQGAQILSPPGYDIRTVKRVNGIQWNGRNTHFKVLGPPNRIVIKNAWPEEATRISEYQIMDKRGRRKTVRKAEKYVRNNVYVPYSSDDPNTPLDIESGIHTAETVSVGTEYSKNVFEMARQILRDRNVRSRAFPQYFAGDLPFLALKAYQRLNMVEHMDLTEFNYNPRMSAERVLVLLGTNQDRAFATCNSTKPSRACGLMQFTDRWKRRNPGTYSTIVRRYSGAKLIKSFPAGAFDHVNAVMASMLLHDNNLANMINIFGNQLADKVLRDPVFAEMITGAAYNGSPTWVHKSLRATTKNNFEGWSQTNHLKKETRGYLVKQQYLIDNDLP